MYQTFYKLRGKPFQLTPDPHMLFPSKGHKRAMSYLLYGLEQREGFVMITGAVGTGKTLLVQTLLDKLADRQMAVASIASANLDGYDVLPAVASAFKLPYEGRSRETLLQDLKRNLAGLQAQQTGALLVVDEAQTLTPAALEVLRALSNLEIRGQALMQIFLIGQTELRHIMVSHHMEQLRQRIIASYRLDPLPADESQAYILHRLLSVGWKNDPELSPDIFLHVHRFSEGIPRRINLVMDRLLLFGYLEERHKLDCDALATVISEIHEEMAGVPATLEEPGIQHNSHKSRAISASEKMNQLAMLETRLNDILKQMRERIKLKQPADPGDPPAIPREVPGLPGTRRTGSKRNDKW